MSEYVTQGRVLCAAREKWLTSAFPKFSGKAKGGKQSEVKPPPHSIKAHSRLELVIGPHVFANTALYEVHYLPQQPIPVANVSQASPLSSKGTPSNAPQAAQTQPRVSGVSTEPPAQSPGVAPLWPSGNPTDPNSSISQSRLGEWVTPALLTQVTRAVGTDPILRNLLELAQKHQLTDEQRATLTSILRALNEQLDQQHDTSLEPHLDSAMPAAQSTLVQSFDLVIEYQEKPSDRWIVPRGRVQLEDTYASNGASRYDVIISVHLATSKARSIAEERTQTVDFDDRSEPSEAVKLHWRGLPQATYDILLSWTRGEPEAVDSSRSSRDTSVRMCAVCLPIIF